MSFQEIILLLTFIGSYISVSYTHLLQHIPARLPEGEHDFYAVREAAAAYYYEDIGRTAVLRCKQMCIRDRLITERSMVRVHFSPPQVACEGNPQIPYGATQVADVP